MGAKHGQGEDDTLRVLSLEGSSCGEHCVQSIIDLNCVLNLSEIDVSEMVCR